MDDRAELARAFSSRLAARRWSPRGWAPGGRTPRALGGRGAGVARDRSGVPSTRGLRLLRLLRSRWDRAGIAARTGRGVDPWPGGLTLVFLRLPRLGAGATWNVHGPSLTVVRRDTFVLRRDSAPDVGRPARALLGGSPLPGVGTLREPSAPPGLASVPARFDRSAMVRWGGERLARRSDGRVLRIERWIVPSASERAPTGAGRRTAGADRGEGGLRRMPFRSARGGVAGSLGGGLVGRPSTSTTPGLRRRWRTPEPGAPQARSSGTLDLGRAPGFGDRRPRPWIVTERLGVGSRRSLVRRDGEPSGHASGESARQPDVPSALRRSAAPLAGAVRFVASPRGVERLPPGTPAAAPLPMPYAPKATTTAPTVVHETLRREVTTTVVEHLRTLVTREVDSRLSLESKESRRMRERVYSELGAQLVFERERLGR